MFPDNTEAHLTRLRDDFAQRFAALVTSAEDLRNWANDHPAQDLGELRNQLGLIGGFADWANTPIAEIGNKSPDRYFRSIRSLGM